MDFLKYLDVLIGLALVMLLLSPAVTAVTQFLMWAGQSRSKGLQKGLRDLIVQLVTGTRDYTIAEVTAPAGARIDITGFGSATVGPSGTARFEADPGEPPAAEWKLTTAPATKVSVKLLHRRGSAGRAAPSAATSATGVTSISYVSAPAGIPSRKATVGIVPAAPGTTVSWKILTGPDAGLQGSLAFTAPGTATFTYPTAAPPADYNLELTATANGASVQGAVIAFDFQRNTSLDLDFGEGTTDKKGERVLRFLDLSGADEIAGHVLLHPMIATPGSKVLRLLSLGPYKGNVIEREELIRILLELAANEGPAAGKLSAELRTRLTQLLAANGIGDAGAKLATIREKSQKLEQEKPELAAHIRQTEAIIESATSEFVGKINNWFDQAMTRATHRYTTWARVWTVASAVLVVAAIRMDSLDLLRRLSADEKLRASLVNEAGEYQKRVESASKQGQAEDASAARAKREEVDQALSKLREPQLAIISDHFFWQKTPRARLVRNPDWPSVPPEEFELALGSATYRVVPDWPGDVLGKIMEAINRSGAPAKAWIEHNPSRDELVVRSNEGPDLRIASKGDAQTNLLTAMETRAFTRIPAPAKVTNGIEVELIVGGKSLKLSVKADEASAAPQLAAAINGMKAGVTATAASGAVSIVADRPEVKWIIVQRRQANGKTDCFSEPTQMVARRGRVSAGRIAEYVAAKKPAELQLAGSVDLCTVCTDVKMEALGAVAATAGFAVDVVHGDALIIDSQRLGSIQLRYAAGKPETNILNRTMEETSLPDGWFWPNGQSFPGLLLSVILLSLGAPFWYDVLKDLLKFRPTLAQKEEKQRNERQTDTSKPTAPAKP